MAQYISFRGFDVNEFSANRFISQLLNVISRRILVRLHSMIASFNVIIKLKR